MNRWDNPRAYPCPSCGASPGYPCVNEDGEPIPNAFCGGRVTGSDGPVTVQRGADGDLYVQPPEKR